MRAGGNDGAFHPTTLTRGNRRLRFRGVAKDDAWLHTRAAAVNLRRLVHVGVTRQNGVWALA